jgi:hypothetical protein
MGQTIALTAVQLWNFLNVLNNPENTRFHLFEPRSTVFESRRARHDLSSLQAQPELEGPDSHS